MFNSPTSAANGFYAFFTPWGEGGKEGRGEGGKGYCLVARAIKNFLEADKSAYLGD